MEIMLKLMHFSKHCHLSKKYFVLVLMKTVLQNPFSSSARNTLPGAVNRKRQLLQTPAARSLSQQEVHTGCVCPIHTGQLQVKRSVPQQMEPSKRRVYLPAVMLPSPPP